jgi:hypothetical protein
MTKLGVAAAVVLCLVGIAVLASSGVAGLLLLALSAAIATALVARA